MTERILATIEAEDFTGRSGETEALRRHAAGESVSPALLLLSAPASGASELLRQFYDALFQQAGELIPFCFAVKKSDRTAKNCAARFLQTFIAQTVAFRHKDTRILAVAPDIAELAELAADDDRFWINRLAGISRTENQTGNESNFVRGCLSAPLRAAAYGTRFFVMIDDLHEAYSFSGEIDFFSEVKEAFSRSASPFVFSGARRFLLAEARTGSSPLTSAEILRVETLAPADAGALAERLATNLKIKINDETRDLIAVQLGGSPKFIKFLFEAARERKADLNDFRKVEQIYADELFGGRIGNCYDEIFQDISPDFETKTKIIKLLRDASKDNAEETTREIWHSRLALSDADFNQILRRLHHSEIAHVAGNRIEAATENVVLNDFIEARFRLDAATAESRGAIFSAMLTDFIKRAPQLMAKVYRQNAAVNLREMLAAFDRQDAPAELIDYAVSKNGGAAVNGRNGMGETEKIRLPQIVYAAHTVAFYPAINHLLEANRSAIAIGFEENLYTDADETVWIAAEIDSKLEASTELAEFWCDRLEMVALAGDFTNYKIWLVAPEGFAPDAIEILRRRGAFGSSRRQIEQLKTFLDAGEPAEKSVADEYEIVVPMSADSELIAAGAIEEIARRHEFPAKAINQIKTALVEACINASEHSLSPDRRIYQKFTIEADKIRITVSNRGLRLTDKNLTEVKPEAGRRGWGLKLMKSLMDEVKIEAVDDGTRISMTKYLK